MAAYSINGYQIIMIGMALLILLNLLLTDISSFTVYIYNVLIDK